MDFGLILKNSFQAVKRKRFWLFGIIHALVTSNFFLSEYRISGLEEEGINYNFQQVNEFNYGQQADPLIEFIQQINPPILIMVGIAIVLLALIAFILRFVLRGALIGGLNQAELGEEPTMRETFKMGWGHAFRLFGVGFMIWLLPVLFILILVGILITAVIPIFFSPKEGIILFCSVMFVFILLMILTIIAFIPIGIIHNLANRVTVIEGKKVFESISRGWKLFKENLGSMLLSWLIILGIIIAFGLVTLLLVGVTIFPFSFVLVNDGSSQYVLFLLLSLPGRIIIIVITGLFAIFSFNYWNGVYKQVEDLTLENQSMLTSGAINSSQ